MKATKRAAGAIVLLTVAALSACSTQIPGAPVSPAPKSERGLEKFYSQKVDWGSCAAMAKADDVDDYDPRMELRPADGMRQGHRPGRLQRSRCR
ncbi:hypothetical protein TPAU25S_03029 [Tsukamurella paurometabola]|uniref:hypothetical protein n=1 Tax=Tsukamurella paurometabola TaxID=2061 RepID=UPI00030A79D5|nr:hypothetical protein [Tsukamurella paurometabola]SUP30270.1 Uncharacterised protein [Tsukamurella paurometabola]